jgi:hypothetical protein
MFLLNLIKLMIRSFIIRFLMPEEFDPPLFFIVQMKKALVGVMELPTHLSCEKCVKIYIIISLFIKVNCNLTYEWAV